MINKARENLVNSNTIDESLNDLKERDGKSEEKFSNRRLLTPRTRKLMNNRDAKEVLFD